MRIVARVAAFALVGILTVFGPARAQDEGVNPAVVPDAPLHEQVLHIPGDRDNPVTLEVTVYTPPGNGPFPLAVMNHGATKASASNRGSRYRFTFSAYYFLSRGYAVALPMMRGFAGSGGSIAHRGCDLADVGVLNARDIRAVINYMVAQPYIDGSRIVAAGQSFGGWNTLALGTLDRTGVRGLVNFSGGIRVSDCSTQDASLIAAAAYFGANTRVPSIWFYGENDQVFPASTWRGVYDRYTRAGGHAELVDVGSFMTDSHQMLSYPEGLAIWAPRVDRFLVSIGLPGTQVYPEYMPKPTPPPTHFAAIGDVGAVPYVNDRGREAYRRFLTRSFPRVFLITRTGGTAVLNGGFDPLGRGLKECAEHGAACLPYAVDDNVVWSEHNAGLAVSAVEMPVVRRTIPADVTTTIDFSYSVNPDCGLRALSKLSVSQQPEHGVAHVGQRSDFPHFPPGSPYAMCNAVRVQGVTLDYTPARGFTGSDFLVFEVVDPDHGHRAYRVALTVR